MLAELSDHDLRQVRERAAHVREVLTGYRAGSPELAAAGEPRPEYRTELPIMHRYEAKAREVEIGVRTLTRWVAEFRRNGEAGLAPKFDPTAGRLPGRVDPRWADVALEVMVEHAGKSTPSRTMVIDRTNARVLARLGDGVMKVPSRATAFRVLEELERRHPTFRLSAKRNRDIADGVYGKLWPTRPGEYVLMDSTRLDVFALDPVTLLWINCELTVAMDWYTRCVTGIWLTPVSTRAVDVASVLFQVFRPRPAARGLAGACGVARARHPAHRAARPRRGRMPWIERPWVSGQIPC